MKYYFDLKKYRSWRKEVEGLDDEVITFIINNHHMQTQDGIDRDELIRQGYIILKEWCVESND